MLPRLARLLPATLLTTLATTLVTTLLLPASPAHADLVGTTSSQDAVLRNTCFRHPIDYSFVVGPGTLLWQTKISVVNPSGRTSEGIDLSSVDSDATSGTVTVLLCGSNEPGTWTVHTTGTYQVLPAVNIPISVADSTFRVRRTPTRTSLRDQHLTGRRYRLVATVEDRRKSGFKPTKSAEVRFQRRVDGVWKNIRGARTLTDRGIATAVVSVSPGTKVRAVTAQAGYLAGSASRGVRLHP